MPSLATSAGTVEILTREESFAELARRLNALAKDVGLDEDRVYQVQTESTLPSTRHKT